MNAKLYYANTSACSWYDFARAIFKIKGIKVKVNPITTDQYPTAAKRPMFSVMDTNRIKETFYVEVPNWKEALNFCLESQSFNF